LTVPQISVQHERSFAVVTLSRADTRNALDEAMLGALLDALRGVAASDARGLLLAAQGPDFCAGHDLTEMANRDEAGVAALLALSRELMTTLQALPQPVVAEVQGVASSAGCELVASCDLVVAGESARFIVPGGAGNWFCHTPGVALARSIGRKHALEMLLTGDAVDAATACRWGLVNRVVRDDLVPAEARELLDRATRGNAESKAEGKRTFYRHVELGSDAAYDEAGAVMTRASQRPEAIEARLRFAEGRELR
jgi:enoyl-CoA hydratase/carnithine racemase